MWWWRGWQLHRKQQSKSTFPTDSGSTDCEYGSRQGLTDRIIAAERSERKWIMWREPQISSWAQQYIQIWSKWVILPNYARWQHSTNLRPAAYCLIIIYICQYTSFVGQPCDLLMLYILLAKLYWPFIKNDVYEIDKSCESWARNRHLNIHILKLMLVPLVNP